MSCCSQTITDSRSDLANNIFKQAENTVISVADPTCPYDPNGSVTNIIVSCLTYVIAYDNCPRSCTPQLNLQKLLILSIQTSPFFLQQRWISYNTFRGGQQFPQRTFKENHWCFSCSMWEALFDDACPRSLANTRTYASDANEHGPWLDLPIHLPWKLIDNIQICYHYLTQHVHNTYSVNV